MDAALRRLAENDEAGVLAIEIVTAVYVAARQIERVANELSAVSYRG